MKKVFLKRTGKSGFLFTEGKEYLRTEDGHVVADDGNLWAAGGPCWQEIERECFEANGETWFRHTPGEPIPCDPEAKVVMLFRNGNQSEAEPARFWSWDPGAYREQGWRFADSAKPEQADRPITSIIKRVCAEYSEDESERNDLIAAVDDGHLTPGQKAYIQAKEDAQAAKQQLAKDAQDKALQERAEQLSDAGKAMDRVNQDHNHKLGWRQ